MQPRMLVTFDEELRPLPVSVRVGQVRNWVEKGGLRYTIEDEQCMYNPFWYAGVDNEGSWEYCFSLLETLTLIFSSHRQWMWWARLESLKRSQGSRHIQRQCCWPMGNGQNWPLRSFFPLPPFWKVLLSSGRIPTMTFKWPLETLGCNWFLAGQAACQGWILFQIFGGIVTSCCFVTK